MKAFKFSQISLNCGSDQLSQNILFGTYHHIFSAAALKTYLRELSTPLLTFEAYPTVSSWSGMYTPFPLSVCSIKFLSHLLSVSNLKVVLIASFDLLLFTDFAEDKQKALCKKLLENIPPVHYSCLRLLILFLNKVPSRFIRILGI